MYSLESPHRLINIKQRSPEIIPNTIMSAAMGLFCKGLKNEFEIAVVNEPSVVEPLKFYCIKICTVELQ